MSRKSVAKPSAGFFSRRRARMERVSSAEVDYLTIEHLAELDGQVVHLRGLHEPAGGVEVIPQKTGGIGDAKRHSVCKPSLARRAGGPVVALLDSAFPLILTNSPAATY
jgi:hypothetical protein